MTSADPLALIESDRAYFELAARIVVLPGVHVAHMEGLAHAAGAVVAHRVDVPTAECDPRDWLSRLTACFEEIGAHLGRIYLERRSEALDAELAAQGYVHRVEHGFVVPRVDAREEVSLAPVAGERATAPLFSDASPDGHDADAGALRRLHERKAEDPAFTWMVVRDRSGAVIGSVAALRHGNLLRGKNIWIDAAHRQRGVGAAVLAELWRVAEAELRWLGLFSVAGSDGDRLYRALGATPIVEWHEWSRSLTRDVSYQRRPPKRRSTSAAP